MRSPKKSVKLSSVLAEIPVITFQIILDGKDISFSYLSDLIETELELKQEDVLNNFNKLLELLPDIEKQSLKSSLDDAARNLLLWKWDGCFNLPSGKTKCMQILAKPTLNGQKKLVFNGLFTDITFYKHTDDMLRETSKLTKTGVWELDLINKSLFWSEEVFRIHELDITIKPDLDHAINYYKPEARPLITNAVDRAIQSGTSWDIELPLTTAKGNEIWVRASGKPVFEGGVAVKLYGSFQDITEQKNAQELIRRNGAMLSETQELTHSGSWEADLVTGKNYWSEEAFRIFGLKPSNQGPDNLTFGRMVHPEDKQLYTEQIQKAITNGTTSSFDLRIVLPDQGIRYINAIGKPFLNEKGQATKLYGAIVDITDRKIAEQELIKAKELAEQAAIAKSQFLSTMSHEIRTPMNAVIGFTNLLLQTAASPEQLQYLKVLKFSGDNLLALINDILDFSKIEEGKIEFETVDFSVEELLDNISLPLSQRAGEKGLQLKLFVDKDLSDAVIGDPLRLGQILTNLITNAIKFTEKGKVTISALLASKDQNNISINFEVADTGIGIAEDKLESIFERFTQANPDTTRNYGGTGLGLTITRKLIELQGGYISVESTVGEGSKFKFSLTFKNGNDQILSQQKPKLVKANKSLKGTKVLVAEDNEINIMLVRQFMKLWDVECDIVKNGLQAVEQVQIKDYDLVLMDLQMPEMDGYQAAFAIRQLKEDKFHTLPIIALTASAMLDIKEKVLEVGMNDYVSKPFNPDELHEKMKMYSGIDQ